MLVHKLDLECNHINNLGCWVKKRNPQILVLTSSITTLHSQLSTLTTKYTSLQALVAQSSLSGDHNNNNKTKLQKPPPKKADKPEITTMG
jgi:hypothetical protein